ncbi:MAG: DUF1553 domain-containing protein [Pirellulales bacterium]
MKKYAGQRAHIELIDDGDGWLAVEDIRLAPKPVDALPELVELFLLKYERTDLKDATGWSKRYLKVFNSVFSAAREKRLSGLRLKTFEWLAQYDLVPLDVDSAAKLKTAIAEHRAALETAVAALPALGNAPAAAEGDAWDDPVYIRGNPKTLGDDVPRRFLTALDPQARPFASGSGRKELAERTVAPDNPLFARVAVNRIWHHLFGRGLASSVDNFGVLGSAPTHPELLDRLATDFQRDGYSQKRMLKRIMLSRAYRMSAAGDPRADEADPGNELLHKQRLRRLSGESLRDMLLQFSGRFDDKMYGPSIPVHLTPFMSGRGKPGEQGPLDGAGRRSIYQIVRRNFPSPLFAAFDTPTPFNTIGKRNESNVPAQALILMNDPFVRAMRTLGGTRAGRKA